MFKIRKQRKNTLKDFKVMERRESQLDTKTLQDIYSTIIYIYSTIAIQTVAMLSWEKDIHRGKWNHRGVLQATSQKKRLACTTSRIVITDLTSKETYSLNTFKVCLPLRISITNLLCERSKP